MGRRCAFDGCDRDATRLFQAGPVNGWLCEDHFQQALNAAAEEQAIERRKLDAKWRAHLQNYMRENHIDPSALTEAQTRQIGDEARRWMQDKGMERKTE